MRVYYSRSGTDLVIKSFFPDVVDGLYVEIASADDAAGSMTRMLYEEGWHGIAAVAAVESTDELRDRRPRDDIRSIGPSSTLGSLLDDSRAEVVHLLTISGEAAASGLLQTYDWQGRRPQLVCIAVPAGSAGEGDRPGAELEGAGYVRVLSGGEMEYFLAEEASFRAAYLADPRPLLTRELIPAHSSELIAHQVEGIDALTGEVNRLQEAWEWCQEQITERDAQIEDLQRQLSDRQARLADRETELTQRTRELRDLRAETQNAWKYLARRTTGKASAPTPPAEKPKQ